MSLGLLIILISVFFYGISIGIARKEKSYILAFILPFLVGSFASFCLNKLSLTNKESLFLFFIYCFLIILTSIYPILQKKELIKRKEFEKLILEN